VCTKCWVLQGATLELLNKQWCMSVCGKSLVLHRTKLWCMCNTVFNVGVVLEIICVEISLKEGITKALCTMYKKLLKFRTWEEMYLGFMQSLITINMIFIHT
jgi:hypothetical protein